MKKILNYIVAASSLFLGSCNLDLVQPDYILDQDAMSNVEDVNQVVIGAYGQMPSIGMISTSSRITDDTRLSSQNRGQGVAIHSWSINSSTGEASSNWGARFRPVLNVNKLFEKVSSINPRNSEEEIALAQYKAEAYAIRAYMHFELLRLYSDVNSMDNLGIPYVTKSGIDIPSRLTVGESFNAIENDLLVAYSLMPESFGNKFRVTKNAVKAMLSRMYLYKKDYANAIKYSSELIATMELSNINNYASIWDDTDDTEIIFSLMKIPGDGAVGSIFTDRNDDIFFSPSYEIMNLVDSNPNDVRNSVIYKYRELDNEPIVAKYLGTEDQPGLNHVKLFRLSEQYLIRSEAYALTNMLAESASDYNALRGNRIHNYVDEAFNTQEMAITRILSERRLELAYEGHRWYDLRRHNLGIERIDEDVVLVPNAKVLPSTDHRFIYMPIPQDEIFANDNMEQNLGF